MQSGHVMSTACYGITQGEIDPGTREWFLSLSTLRLRWRWESRVSVVASARGRASGWSRRDHGKQSKLNLKLLDILFVRLLYVARGLRLMRRDIASGTIDFGERKSLPGARRGKFCRCLRRRELETHFNKKERKKEGKLRKHRACEIPVDYPATSTAQETR